MKLSPIEKRAARQDRNKSMMDLNLVSLIDIFIILVFFLLTNSMETEVLPSSKAVRLPESIAEKSPMVTVMVTISAQDILVQGKSVASVPEVLDSASDLIEPLKAELDLQASRQVIRKEREAESRTVTIMGDKEIPYRLLRKVMVTCARAHYNHISFAVLQKGKA